MFDSRIGCDFHGLISLCLWPLLLREQAFSRRRALAITTNVAPVSARIVSQTLVGPDDARMRKTAFTISAKAMFVYTMLTVRHPRATVSATLLKSSALCSSSVPLSPSSEAFKPATLISCVMRWACATVDVRAIRFTLISVALDIGLSATLCDGFVAAHAWSP